MLNFFIFKVNAQIWDSIKEDLMTPASFFVNLDQHNSFVSSRLAKINGVRFGLSYQEKYKIGFGFYGLSSATPLTTTQIVNGDTVYPKLNLGYFSFCYEYVFYQKYPWQFSVPVQVGIGNSFFDYTDKAGKYHKTKEQLIMLYEPAVIGQWKALKWVGLGFGVGYRLMLVSNPTLNQKFNSPIYSLGIRIFFDEIYHSLSPKKK